MLRTIIEIVASVAITAILALSFVVYLLPYIIAPFGSPAVVIFIYALCLVLFIGLFILIRTILFRWTNT